MKTVSQLAAELNVNRTTLHRLIQRNNIETLQEGNKRLIDAQAEQAILKAFNEKSLHGETLQNNNKLLQQRNVAQAEQLANKDKTIESLQAQLTEKDNQNSLLKSQITDKDNQISLLQSQLADRDKTIDLLQSQLADFKADKQYLKDKLDDITTALTAAQALHGIEKKQTVIDVKEQANDSEPAETTAPDQTPTPQEPKQKLSLFERLFKRGNRSE